MWYFFVKKKITKDAVGTSFFRASFAFSILTPHFLLPSSVSVSYFILAVPMRKCLGKHSCMSYPFPIAILNGTFFFRSVKAMNNWKLSAIKQTLLLLLVVCGLKNMPSSCSVNGCSGKATTRNRRVFFFRFLCTLLITINKRNFFQLLSLLMA